MRRFLGFLEGRIFVKKDLIAFVLEVLGVAGETAGILFSIEVSLLRIVSSNFSVEDISSFCDIIVIY